MFGASSTRRHNGIRSRLVEPDVQKGGIVTWRRRLIVAGKYALLVPIVVGQTFWLAIVMVVVGPVVLIGQRLRELYREIWHE